jgi:DNA polymerase
MNPILYCMHPETEIISMAYKFNDGTSDCVFGEDNVKDWAASIDWSDVLVVGHNLSGFDVMLCAWRLGIRPKMWGCTLAMARPFFQVTVGGSLAKVAAALGVGVKGSLEATNTKGKHLRDFTPEEIVAMREYNILDVELCYGVFEKLAPLTSKQEMQLIDATIRMLSEPMFELDADLLERTLGEDTERQRDLLLTLAANMDRKGLLGDGLVNTLRHEDDIVDYVKTSMHSAGKFVRVLEELGVEVPTKQSPTNPDKRIPAISKTDEAMVALTEHEDEIVAAAAQARLDVKSTLLASRIGQFLAAANAVGGKIPIPLNYYAATTGRWGGGLSMNMQNLPRVARDKSGNITHKPTNALRLSLRAPKGYKVIVSDLSGIELRVNHFLWKVPSSMALYQADPEKADLYKDFASTLYEVEVKDVTKDQRQIGKIAHLGLGFGAGASTFVRIAKMMGGVNMSEAEALKVVRQWRTAYKEIQNGWKTCGSSLAMIFNEAKEDLGTPIDPWGLCTIAKGGIKTPTGMIRYPQLEFDKEEQSFWYGEGRNRARITGPKVDENIVQHLARCIMSEQLLKIRKRYNVVHTVHDEIVCIAREEEAEDCLNFMLETMRTPPVWWPELVVWSEGDVADSYGEAK